MKNWIVADCETDPFDGNEIAPFIWAVFDGERSTVFDNPKTATADFIAFVSGFKGIVYAHNGGNFDWKMPEILEAIDDDSALMIISGRIAKAKLGKCELRDSWLCLPVALKQFEKKGFNYSWLTKANREKMMPKIRDYIISDVVNLYKPLARFFAEHGQCFTQAGAALRAWEGMGGEKRRYSETHYNKFKPFYFGGRVSVFKYCNGESVKRKLYDVNSAYPFAMTESHPLGEKFIKSCDLSRIVGYSFWTVKAVSRGCLPFREADKSVSYPDDDKVREYKVGGWELIAGIETGTLEIFSGTGLIPVETETLKPYVDKFMADKESAERCGDSEGRTIAKIFLNSLYGKFACNPEKYSDFKIGVPDDEWRLFQAIPTADGKCRMIVSRRSKYGSYLCVALAASITSHARANLWRAICSVENPVYCDTDSVLASSCGSLEVGNKLGEWSVDAESERAWIGGKKLYTLELTDGEYKTASKGVRATADEIKRVCAGEVVNIKNDAPCLKLDGRQIFTDRRIKIT